MNETRIGFGATVLARGLAQNALDGIGTYTLELARALSATQNIALVPTVFGDSAETLNNLLGKKQSVQFPRFAERALASALTGVSCFDSKKARANFSLYHATDHLIPKLRGVPVVATIMDAIPISHPQWIQQKHAGLKRWLWRRTAQWADHVITISEFSKQEIVQHFGIPASNISVTPLGVDARYFTRVDAATCAQVRAKFGVPEHFFLFVGTLQPRKNVGALLAAHAQLPDETRKAHPLVIAGRAGWNCDELIAALRAEQHNGCVYWLEYVTDLEKRALMASAVSLAFVSLYEGFGLPVVEAFATQLPVICANSSSLTEVADDAALRVNPVDPEAIAHAMRNILTDTARRNQLAERGLARAKLYTWAACAAQTRTIYELNK